MIIVVVGAFGCTSMARAQNAVARTYDVAFRGNPWQEAMESTASQIGVRLWIDPAVPTTTRQTPIRFAADTLSATQVLRWIARLGDVAVLRVGDSYVCGEPGAWPVAWQARWRCVGGDVRTRPPLRVHRLPIHWADLPVAAASAFLRREWAVDAVVEPSILVQQPLLSLEAADADIADVVQAMADQLDASFVLYDGLLVFGSRPWLARITGTEPGQARPEWVVANAARTVPAPAPVVRLAPIFVAGGPGAAAELVEQIKRHGGVADPIDAWVARVTAGSEAGIEASGTVAQVIEGLRLLAGAGADSATSTPDSPWTPGPSDAGPHP